MTSGKTATTKSVSRPCGSLRASCVLAAVLAGFIAAWACGQSDQGPSNRRAVLTADDLASAVEANWSRIEDISVSFSVKTVGECSPGVTGFDLLRVVIKRDKLYAYSVSPGPANHEASHREVAFNGEVTTISEPQRARAMIRPSREPETFIRSIPLIAAMGYNYSPPPTKSGLDVDNLAFVLRNCRGTVRESLEQVDGHDCCVVDFQGPQGWPVRTMWIAPSRGYLPIKIETYSGNQSDGTLSVVTESHIDEAMEVAPGLWFPLRVRTMVNLPGSQPLQSRYEILVNRLENGSPDLAVNAAVDDAFFDLWKRLPPGTSVIDVKSGVTFTVGGDAYNDMAKALETVPEFTSLPVPERVGPRQDTGASAVVPVHAKRSEPCFFSTVSLRAILLVSVLVLLVVAFLTVRKRHSQGVVG